VRQCALKAFALQVKTSIAMTEVVELFEALLREQDVVKDPQLAFILKLVLRDERFHHMILHDLY